MATIRLKDEEIQHLIQEAKPLPLGLRSPLKGVQAKNGHYRQEIKFSSAARNEFIVNLRKSAVNPDHFSVILQYRIPGSNKEFRLRRYNSKHTHSNPLEDEKFCDFHIHTATERYQREGYSEDHFAEVATGHFDFPSAIERFLEDCGFDTTGLNYTFRF